MATTTTQLPHWDLSTIFPSLESPEFATAVDEVTAKLAALEDGTRELPSGAAIDDATAEWAATLQVLA